jgi:hypothetical protein
MPDLTKPKSRNDFTSLLFVNTMKNAANPGVLHFMMLTKSVSKTRRHCSPRGGCWGLNDRLWIQAL